MRNMHVVGDSFSLFVCLLFIDRFCSRRNNGYISLSLLFFKCHSLILFSWVFCFLFFFFLEDVGLLKIHDRKSEFHLRQVDANLFSSLA